MIHDKDGAEHAKRRFSTCGTCLTSFPAASAQESADLCKAHVDAGCSKARKPLIVPRGQRFPESPTTAVEDIVGDDDAAHLW